MKHIKLLALIMAIITGVALYIYINQSNDGLEEIAKANVMVATQDILENTKITEDMVKLIAAPIDSILPQTYDTSSYVIGMTSRVDIMAGEQIISKRLVEVGSSNSGSLAYMITPGMRAITIGVNDTSGLKFMIKPGDFIDIVAQYQIERQKLNAQGVRVDKLVPEATLLLQKVLVLAVDQDTQKTKETNYTTLTLEVTTEQAVRVSISENNGLLRAILRSPLDQDTITINNITIADIIG